MDEVMLKSELLVAQRKLSEADEGSSERAFWSGYVRALEWAWNTSGGES